MNLGTLSYVASFLLAFGLGVFWHFVFLVPVVDMGTLNEEQRVEAAEEQENGLDTI